MSEHIATDGAQPSDLFMPDAERVSLAVEALWELESLARVLGERAEELAASDLWVRGIAVRLCDLACVGMTALNDGLPAALPEARSMLRRWPAKAD